MSENEGFFKKFYEAINSTIDAVIEKNFANLETNAKRVYYLFTLPVIKSYDLASEVEKCDFGGDFPVKKDLEKAVQLKEDGNNAVAKGDWNKALNLYSQSMVYMPKIKTEELSIVIANRSAALNHLDLHEEALADIKRCLALGYPRHLRYKVYERKARCLMLLKRNQEAVTAFQDTISSLDDAQNLEKTKRQKLRTDARLMVEMLKKGLVLAGNPKDPEPIEKLPPKPKLTGSRNAEYPAASEAVKIDYDNAKGRFATAVRDIEVGEVLLVEKPHSGVLLGEYSKTHCQHCFIKCSIPLACSKCPNVVFCSEKCLDTAQNSYHGYECHILPLLWKSNCSITCHIALRMITQKQKEYFYNIKSDLEDKPTGPYKTDNYRNVYHLEAHENERTKKDLIHRALMTTFLVKLLEISGYFEGKPRDQPVEISELKSMDVNEKHKDDVEFFGGLILKNLQILQFNAHEVFELQCLKPKVGQNIVKHNGKSVFLAGAIFPTLALFNHSCDPSVVRYFCGPQIVVRAIKNIKKGEEVSENYGPMFTKVPKSRRLLELKDQYWFDCTCIPCEQNWPLYADMNENYLRFKCDSDEPCSNVIAVPHECKEFMVQCGLCQQHTNILKGLKSLRETDQLHVEGTAAMNEGKYGAAVKKFIEVLKLYDAFLAPPYRFYYDCVEDMRRCMLAMGNYSVV